MTLTLDWKERLKKDTSDFIQRKLPQHDYDVDIIYNAFPERIENKVPQIVITYVAKIISSKLAKDAEKYFDFYDYILEHKGENGKIIFAYIMAKALRNNAHFFLNYLENILKEIDDQKECNLIIDKAIFPMIRRNPLDNLDLLRKWIKFDNQYLLYAVQKMIIKLFAADNNLIKPIFKRIETLWLYASPNMIKMNTAILKSIYKLDKKYYVEIFEHYKTTRNPLFAEILSGAILCKNEIISTMVENWNRSGNIKLKRVGQHAKKIISKKGIKPCRNI